MSEPPPPRPSWHLVDPRLRRLSASIVTLRDSPWFTPVFLVVPVLGFSAVAAVVLFLFFAMQPPGDWLWLAMAPLAGLVAHPVAIAIFILRGPFRRLRLFLADQDSAGRLRRCSNCLTPVPDGLPSEVRSCACCGHRLDDAAELLGLPAWQHLVAAVAPKRLHQSHLRRLGRAHVRANLGAVEIVVAVAFIVGGLAALLVLSCCGPPLVVLAACAFALWRELDMRARERGAIRSYAAFGDSFGLCINCGYELAITMAQGGKDCPECGCRIVTLSELTGEMPWLR